jgi:hypothetical protein
MMWASYLQSPVAKVWQRFHESTGSESQSRLRLTPHQGCQGFWMNARWGVADTDVRFRWRLWPSYGLRVLPFLNG